ncbi:phosphoribosylglycinamide formyltransferase 2 [Mycobacterium saskatchewanense]|nr:phosphoribosylglycinamide formyltransferase 2 [Mycobacterium saskatchewanense]
MTDGPNQGQPGNQPPPAARGPRVMLLGSGELSRELAIALRRLGATVIAADARADAPAHGVADEALVVPLTDGDELTRAVQRVRPDFVVTTTRAVAVDALERLGAGPAELVPGARSVRLTADRESLRRLAADELGLPTAPFWFVGSADELEAVGSHAGYPLLVRPAAGRGRSVVSGPGDIAPAWQRAGARRVLAETVVEVESSVTLLLVRTEGPHGPVIDFCSPIGHDDGDAPESWQPQPMSAAAMDSARSIAARIVKALGGRGVFGVELMINGDEVYFADVSARPRGSAWVTVRSQRLSAFELQARAILGLPVDTMMISPGAARAIVASPGGGAPTAAALGGALGVPESDLRLFGPSSGKLGVALATAPEVGAARDRARQVATALNVPDSRG